MYAALYALYAHAYGMREALHLTELERSETRYQMRRFLILVAVGCLAAGLAHIRALLLWSGMAYMLIWPAMMIHRRSNSKARPRRSSVPNTSSSSPRA
ncbi:MAG: hypothetical protein M3R59_05755 [Verrucomicrobiota bacterium]|nr:hypothetical protein [Verrucomicrobiota bacterium]